MFSTEAKKYYMREGGEETRTEDAVEEKEVKEDIDIFEGDEEWEDEEW